MLGHRKKTGRFLWRPTTPAKRRGLREQSNKPGLTRATRYIANRCKTHPGYCQLIQRADGYGYQQIAQSKGERELALFLHGLKAEVSRAKR